MARRFQADPPGPAKALADVFVQLGMLLQRQGQPEQAFEAYRRAYDVLLTAQPPSIRFHKGRELASMGAARLDQGMLREGFRWTLIAFLEDCLSRAEDSPGIRDELHWPAAQLLRRFGFSEADLLGLSKKTRARARKGVVKDPTSLIVAEGLDPRIAKVPERAPSRAAGPVRVFVSSPGDLRRERILVADVCSDLAAITGRDVRALLWEGAGPTHPESPPFPATLRGEPGQSVINDRIKNVMGGYEVYLGMIWVRMGTPTGKYRSGTEAELRYALKEFQRAGRPQMFFYTKRISRGRNRDPGVDDFIADVRGLGLPQTFRSATDLRKLLLHDLGEALRSL